MSLRSKLIRLAHQQPALRGELLPLLGRDKTAADEIDLYDLSPSYLNLVKMIEKTLGVKAEMVWLGGFGYIVDFTLPGRMDPEDLRKVLAAREIRWIEFRDRNLSVGM